MTPADVLAAAVRRSAAAPLLTCYDDATDERMELSAATLANWVAKTANLLQEEFDVGPGSSVAVALPVHWQTAAVLLGTWSCGAAVVDTAAEDDGRLAECDVVLSTQDRIAPLEDTGLVATARELAGRLGIGAGDRVLVDDRTAAETGPVAWLLAPLAAGASVVLSRNTAPDRLPRRTESERVTATLGAQVEGVRELGRPG